MDHGCGVSQCGRPTQDVICSLHVRELTLNLKLLCVEHGGGPSLLEELDVVITRQAKIVGAPIGIVVRSAETKLLHNDAASDLRIGVYRDLATWGIVAMDANPHLQRRQRTPVEAGAWLSTIPGLLANLPGVVVLWETARRRRLEVERAIDRPPTMVFLGDCAHADDGEPCTRHLYAALDDDNRPPAWIRCPMCGAEHEVLERQRALIAQARRSVGTAAEVARVLGRIGINIQANTIRSYARRRVVGKRVYEARLRAVDVTDDKHPLYLINDVLDVYLGVNTSKEREAA
jgi:hypothetical protein